MLSCFCADCFQEVSFCGGCSPYSKTLAISFRSVDKFLFAVITFLAAYGGGCFVGLRPQQGQAPPPKGVPSPFRSRPHYVCAKGASLVAGGCSPPSGFQPLAPQGGSLVRAYRPRGSGER